MSVKFNPRLVQLVLLMWLIPAGLFAQTTVAKSWAGSQSIDNSNFTAPSVSFTSGVDFPANNVITSITCSITFSKVDNTCASPGAGDPFNDEIRFQLRGPSSLPTSNRRMINFNGFTGTSNSGTVTMTFDGTTALPANPTTGTYDADQEFSVYEQESPFGSWTVRGRDNFADDPLCFFGYTITITADDPLPVTYLYQSAERLTAYSSIVKWATASEINSAFFLLERSEDGDHWSLVDTIVAKGMSNEQIEYERIDQNAPAAEHYYRISQYDLDGSVHLSNLLYVKPDREPLIPIKMKLLQNPVVDQIDVEISSPAQLAGLSLYNLQGGLMHNFNLNQVEKSRRFSHSTVDLNNGIYVLIATSTQGETYSEKIIVQHLN